MIEKDFIENEPAIIVNNVFAGGYCLDGNIGHEVINFYKANGGKQYCYINPYGVVNEKNIGDRNCVVLFVQHYSTGKYLVVAKAEVTAHLHDKENDKQIKYGNVSLEEIFKCNKTNDDCKALISYEVVKFLKTIKPIIIETGSDSGFKSDKPLRYLYTVRTRNDNNGNDYSNLKAIIDREDNWIEEKVNEVSIPKNFEPPCFLGLIGKGKYELAFSNLFAYIFSLHRHK